MLDDRIAAIDKNGGPDEDDVLTATVVHLLNTHRGHLHGGTVRILARL
jgi:hypothetical protein